MNHSPLKLPTGAFYAISIGVISIGAIGGCSSPEPAARNAPEFNMVTAMPTKTLALIYCRKIPLS